MAILEGVDFSKMNLKELYKIMTQKQKDFVIYYIGRANCNATLAAEMAGYSKKTAKQIGCENLSKLYLKRAIEIELQKIEDAKIMDKDEVLRLLTSIARGELTEDAVVVENMGDFTTKARIMKKGTSIKDRLSASKEMAKRYALDKPDQGSETPPVIIVNTLPGGDKIGN